MTSFRRTRAAILDAAKTLIAQQGISASSMIEIADTAQVSRATLYNHFRDKGAVFRALIESEIERIFESASGEPSIAEFLTKLSLSISSDSALATMRRTDPSLLATLVSTADDPLWRRVEELLATAIGREEMNKELVDISARWLIGQVFQPLGAEAVAAQAEQLAKLVATPSP